MARKRQSIAQQEDALREQKATLERQEAELAALREKMKAKARSADTGASSRAARVQVGYQQTA